MNKTPVRYNTSYDSSYGASYGSEHTPPEVPKGSPSKLPSSSHLSVEGESPRLIVSPKMQNIHMLVQNEGADSPSRSNSVADMSFGEQEEPQSRKTSSEQRYSGRSNRNTLLWAQSQAEVDAQNEAHIRAEAKAFVKAQEVKAREEARATAQDNAGMKAEYHVGISVNRQSLASPIAGAHAKLGTKEQKYIGERAPLEEKAETKGEAEHDAEGEVEVRGEIQKKVETESEEEVNAEEEAEAKVEESAILRLNDQDTTIQENKQRSEAQEKEQRLESQAVEQKLEAQETAVKIVQGIYDKISYREYANFLGAKENYQVLQKFIVLLEPLPNSLVLSLYKLVTRIYFIAEAQAIDRILEELSKGWVTANPETHWGRHYKLCHIVLFALLILNSDLHNTENLNNQTKFSKEEFVDNTIYAVSKEGTKSNFNLPKYEPAIREELGIYYDALKYMSLPVLSREESKRDRESKDYRESKNRIRRKNSKVSSKSQLAPSAENSSSDDEASSLFSGSSTSFKRESHYTSNWRFHNNKPLPTLYHKESFDEQFRYTNNTLWYVDSAIEINERNLISPSSDRSTTQRTNRFIPSSGGILRWITRSKSKSLLHENRSPVAFFDGNTRWTNVRCRVWEGRIYVFRTRPQSMEIQNNEDDLANLKKISDVYFVCSLYEALATLVQENVVVHNNQRPAHLRHKMPDAGHVHRGNFTVTIPAALHRDKTVLEFQTGTVEEAQNYVNCVNFWAARLTPVPTAQFEIVSNEENGWSPSVLSGKAPPTSLDKVYVSSWKPLLSIGHLYSEQENNTEEAGMTNKIEALQNFTEYLQQTIDSHNKVKPHMISVWRKTRNFDKAMDNWNKKYLYLNELDEKSSAYLYTLNLSLTCIR